MCARASKQTRAATTTTTVLEPLLRHSLLPSLPPAVMADRSTKAMHLCALFPQLDSALVEATLRENDDDVMRTMQRLASLLQPQADSPQQQPPPAPPQQQLEPPPSSTTTIAPSDSSSMLPAPPPPARPAHSVESVHRILEQGNRAFAHGFAELALNPIPASTSRRYRSIAHATSIQKPRTSAGYLAESSPSISSATVRQRRAPLTGRHRHRSRYARTQTHRRPARAPLH